MRKSKEFDVSIDFNCQSVINPIADVSKFLGSAGNNYAQYDDQVLEDMYGKLVRAGDGGRATLSCASTRSGRSTKRPTWA